MNRDVTLWFFPLALLVGLATQPACGRQQIIDDQPLAADPELDVLVERVAAWHESIDSSPPDLSAIALTPAAFRGQAFHLTTGPATRVAASAFDINHLSAWQTSSPAITEPILLLIYEPGKSAAPGDHVDSIDLPACFYKTSMATMHLSGSSAGAGVDPPSRPAQRILVFVGALPQFAAPPDARALAWGNLVAALLVGGVLLLLVRRYALRRSARRPRLSAAERPRESWNDANLPEEPAEALAELRRRSDDTITHD